MTAISEPYFLLSEDESLRDLLKGVTVSDMNNKTRSVQVYFGMPDIEIRPQSYPYLVIDLIDVAEDKSRVQSQYGPPIYAPPNAPVESDTAGFSTAMGDVLPVTPMILVYQITSFARHPRHDRQIISTLTHNALHPRYAQLPVANDGTLRRLIVAGFSKRDLMEQNKRLFRNMWTVQMPSEIYYSPLTLTARVSQVMINQAGSLAPAPSTIDQPVLYP